MSERGFDFYISGIEDGIIAALDQAIGHKTAQNGYVKTIGSYGGELDSKELRTALDSLTPLLPLILVCYGEGEDVQAPPIVPFAGIPRIFRHDCLFSVFCCSGDARGDKARRRGAGNSPGVYKMIADVREILGGLKLKKVDGDESVLLNPEPLTFDGVRYFGRFTDLTIYAADFSTYFKFTEPDRQQPGELVREFIFEVENTYPKGDSNLPGVSLDHQESL